MLLPKLVSKILFLNLILVSSVFAENAIQIKNPWSPDAPPVVKVMAGYMEIHNTSNKDIKVESASSPLFEHVEIHQTKMENGMMRMIRQENLLIKANSSLELKPGSYHIMLITKLKKIDPGSIIPISLKFDNNQTLNIKSKVKSSNEPEMKCGSNMKCGSM